MFGNGADPGVYVNIVKDVSIAELILRKGYLDLLSEDEVDLILFWNELEESRKNFERNSLTIVDLQEGRFIQSKFAFARLLIATVLQRKGHISPITAIYTEKELGLCETIEIFSYIDDYSIEELKERIGRKEGKVYGMVKSGAEKIVTSLDNIFEDPEIKNAIRRAVKDLFNDRISKIKEAVIEYIRTNPGGITRTIDEIEKSVIDTVKESEETRNKITEEFQLKISLLENQLDEALRSVSRKGELENRLIEMEKLLLSKDFEKKSLETKIDSLELEKSRILDNYSSIDKVLDERIREVESKRKMLEEKEKELLQAKNNIKTEMENENRKILQNELDKITQMKSDIESQSEAIAAEKKSLEFQKEEMNEKFNFIKKAIEGSDTVTRFIPTDLAKLYEMDYIGRFDMKMYDFPISIKNPIDNKQYNVNSWDDNHSKLNDLHKIHETLKNKISISEVESQLPLNVRSRFEIKERTFKIFGRKEPKTIVEAMVFNHWKEYSMNGFDTKPVTLAELNGILVHVINNAEKGKYFHLISIVSPTGWDSKIKTYLQSEDFSKNYVSRYISLCLIDTETGELLYNKSDVRIQDYIHLFEPETDLEKVIKCKKHIKTKYEYDDHVVLDKIVEEAELDTRIVRKAFHDLEAEGYGNILYIDGVGIVLKK